MLLFFFLLSLNCLTECSEENNSINFPLCQNAFSVLPDEVLVVIGKFAINSKTPQYNITRCNTKFYKLIFPEFIENFIKVARPIIFTSDIEFLRTHFTNKVLDNSEDFIIKKKDKQYMFESFNLEQLLKDNNFNSIVRIVVHQETTFDKLFREINKDSFKNFTPNKRKKLEQLFLSSHHALLFSKNTEKLKLLLRSGVDPNIKNKYKATALHYAASYGSKDIVELLLKHDADPNIQNDSGETALNYAILKNNYDIVELLLKHDADPNIQNDYGETALHWAILFNHKKDIVELLLKHGADSNIKNSNGRTALHLAVEYGNKDIVKLLLQYQANPNIKDNKGFSPLYVARAKNMHGMVQLLIENGADPNIQNNDEIKRNKLMKTLSIIIILMGTEALLRFFGNTTLKTVFLELKKFWLKNPKTVVVPPIDLTTV